MHIRFPKKVEGTLRYLKLKLLPKTLFFRTMLLIIIPLIVVQIVSVIAYFSGSWGKVGRRLSDNFEGIKITGALSAFDQLKFADFLKELKKQKPL